MTRRCRRTRGGHVEDCFSASGTTLLFDCMEHRIGTSLRRRDRHNSLLTQPCAVSCPMSLVAYGGILTIPALPPHCAPPSMQSTQLLDSDSGVTTADSKKLALGGDHQDALDARFGGRDARAKLERRLVWKLDMRMAILIVMYILNYIDRNNASAARLRGFESDLHLGGQDLATLLSILYVGYILMQIPSNMFLNRIGKPSVYLPGCMVIWGVISALTGVTTKGFVGALLTRFFLGFVQAAFFPGALFLLSKWYTKKELGVRIALLSYGNIISIAFNSLLAIGILDAMQGKLGHAAWRWLFYLEGAATVLCAVAAIFVLPDFPETTRWLTDKERALAMHRMAADFAGISDQEDTKTAGHLDGLRLAAADWTVWWLAVALASNVLSLSFNAYFPTLTQTLGFDSTMTLVLSAPPFLWAAIEAFAVSRHSDVVQERFWHITIPLLVGILGFVIAMSTMNVVARYISLFLMAQPYAGFVIFYAWIINSFPRPPSKRAVALAGINAFAQFGNIAGSYIWKSDWEPTFRVSYIICSSCQGLAIVMLWFFRRHLKGLNEGFDRAEETGKVARGFRYVL
ncbi:major facilitator superfamily domain-containing protein [Gloeopeniophorella convolvens]|nr:major facilitator superfamily domain-containing protein [Gloeopeniophorella convolvens]